MPTTENSESIEKSGDLPCPAVVPIQNLNTDVLMMETAEDWYRCNAAELLRPPKIRSVFI
jgi:hypothetical protein